MRMFQKLRSKSRLDLSFQFSIVFQFPLFVFFRRFLFGCDLPLFCLELLWLDRVAFLNFKDLLLMKRVELERQWKRDFCLCPWLRETLKLSALPKGHFLTPTKRECVELTVALDRRPNIQRSSCPLIRNAHVYPSTTYSSHYSSFLAMFYDLRDAQSAGTRITKYLLFLWVLPNDRCPFGRRVSYKGLHIWTSAINLSWKKSGKCNDNIIYYRDIRLRWKYWQKCREHHKVWVSDEY